MVYTTYIDPMITLVQRYFEQRRTLASNKPDQGNASEIETGSPDWQEDLPDSPCRIVRDNQGKVSYCLYGDYNLLGAGGDQDAVIWQQKIIRDGLGRAIQVETTYPDGSTKEDIMVRDAQNLVTEVV